MKKHKLMLASLAVLGAGFLATSSNVQAAEQNNTGFIVKMIKSIIMKMVKNYQDGN